MKRNVIRYFNDMYMSCMSFVQTLFAVSYCTSFFSIGSQTPKKCEI